MGLRAKLRRFKVWREKPGVIAPVGLWMLIDNEGPWLYSGETIADLAYCTWAMWKSDKVLVG